VAQNIGSGLITTDPEGKITSANQIAAEFVAAEAASAGRHRFTLRAAALTTEGRLAFLQSTSATAPTEFQHNPGSEQPLLVRCTATPLKDTWEHRLARSILQDVTALQEIAEHQRGESEVVVVADSEISADDGEDAPSVDGFVGRSPACSRSAA
jgi:PAS domain-containing protein